MYSKLHQINFAYMETIQYNKTQCPICKRIGQYHTNTETEDIECECGHIIHTKHQYCAGQKINTDISYKTKRRHKNDK